VFDAEDEDNWEWFLENLHKVIGDPLGLVLCSDACKGLEKPIIKVFPEAENRKCMRHMYGNFMKHYTGDVFTDHLYPVAKSYTEYMFKWHRKKIFEFAPDAINYLEENHARIWYRCGFSELSKCDYLTNNVSESFTAQIKHLKALHLYELVDRIRELIMEKRHIRRHLA
jgi:transposase-like protein